MDLKIKLLKNSFLGCVVFVYLFYSLQITLLKKNLKMRKTNLPQEFDNDLGKQFFKYVLGQGFYKIFLLKNLAQLFSVDNNILNLCKKKQWRISMY